MTKNVFAYTRVSTVRQGTQGSSLIEQKAAIERYATANGLRISGWYEEQETAAKRGRPIFNAMLARLKVGEATGVIIHKIDRSARNLRDWADLGELVDQGFEIHLAHESLDMKSRGGRLAADIQAVVAADYIRNLRQEVIKGIQGRLKQGLFPWPAPPGYLDQGGGKPKTIDPIKAPLIQRLFQLYASGEYSLTTLSLEARAMGLVGRDGRWLSRNGLSTIFHNHFYIGIIVHRPTGERFIGVHEPLISTKLFDTVQDVLQGKQVKKICRHTLAFRRFIRCAGCGYYIVGERRKGWVYYRCHTQACHRVCVREDRISAHLRADLKALILPAAVREELRAEFLYLMEERFGDRERIRRSQELALARNEERMKVLTDRYLDGDIERRAFVERKNASITERGLIRDQLASLAATGNPLGTEFEQFFGLQESLYQSKSLLSEADLSRWVTMTTSNRRLSGKTLLMELNPTYAELRDSRSIPVCGPARPDPRTFRDRGGDTTATKALAQRIFGIWLRASDDESIIPKN